MLNKAKEILKKYFGYDDFREGQNDIIKSILSNCDTVGILPTGGGKSICYQVPGVMLSGVTLVISPLISLMKDQVDNLNDYGISSTYINSSLTAKEFKEVSSNILKGIYKIIYVAPERLDNELFLDIVSKIKVSQVAIDEAHCISQWGHDFRPSYLNIAPFIASFKERPLVTAFTATATPKVKEDIIKTLKIKPNIFQNGFDRPNLTFSVIRNVDNMKYIKEFIEKHTGDIGIIYVATRKECESIQKELSKKYKVALYHAGLSDKDRSKNQEDFLYDRVDIVVATNAFGMGIDKSNVRWVIHNNIPKDLESYYQEAGRAGRDGLPSECVLIYAEKDVLLQRMFIDNGNEYAPDHIKKIKYDKLQALENYCRTTGCLRSHILEYFGDEKIENCQNCSVCLDERDEEDVTREAKIIISCIGRTKQRYGASTISLMLKGSSNKQVLQFGLDKISTYGMLKSYKIEEIRVLIDFLIGDGYLGVTPGQFPVLTLTEKAYEFIKSDLELRRKVSKVVQHKEINSKVNEELFEKLRNLRYEISQKYHLPPYMIFPDKTLKEFATIIPKSKEEMLMINGVGEIKFNKYGEEFLKILNK